MLRLGPGVSSDFLPPGYDGLWLDRSQMLQPGSDLLYDRIGIPTAIATPTGRFETREDGVVAEVWEFRL